MSDTASCTKDFANLYLQAEPWMALFGKILDLQFLQAVYIQDNDFDNPLIL